MRAHLLGNQNRQLSGNPVLLRHDVCRRVRSDCKFTDRQRFVMIQQIFFYINMIVLFFFEVSAVICRNHAVRQRQAQIAVIQLVQIDARHMEHARRSGKQRGSKDLSDRNIAVCDTVLEVRLFLRIFQVMQHHAQIRLVFPFSEHMNRNALIERINQVLLDTLVFLIIERVDLHNFTENFFVARVNFRHRIGNDCVAVLIFLDIAVHNLPRLVLEADA